MNSIFLSATAVGTISGAAVADAAAAAGAGCPEFGCIFMSLLCAHWLYVSFKGVCMMWLVGS